jgi:3-oxoacyl-[acyl-carrier protein] reductase
VLGLAGKRALVTGASKGVGEACARLLANLGVHIAVHFKEDEAAADRVVQAARAEGVHAEALRADLSRWDEGERLVAQAEERIGPLDVAILNHGIWKEAAVEAMTAAEYDETLDANLRGYFSVAGAVVRRMKPRRSGRIVFVSSTAGQRGEPLHAHYAASKGAAISLTKSLAVELAPWGILVNCVAPGWVRTPMTEATLDDAREQANVLRAIPLGRVAAPEEIAKPIAFLASEGASFVTGEILNVNGGAVLVG